ncbi:IMP dehydrogenase [Candidatus Woesearchaeota archaeon CG_4_10_14_0_2_um_filter_33_13]|nr:MAG: IMP dehydrogenase [Candidatus Woesearchaeota archaeon CG_4_10_14_0_2_um_filter_33_13]
MKLGLTYSNVLLVPKRTSLTSRSEADVKTRFTKNVSLNIPLVSANMATVTEHKMAIALAREGGLGIIHQFGTVKEQVEEVKKVKRRTSYIIDDPITVKPNITIREAVKTMEDLDITSLLVMEQEQLIGIFTSRDYLFEENWERPISEVMTPQEKLVTAPFGISIEQAKKILYEHRIEKLPLMENGRLKGLITTKDIKRIDNWPNSCRNNKGQLVVGAAIGIKDAMERAKVLIEAGVDVLVLDVAHAHSDLVIEKLKELKSTYQIDVMVGNIATAGAAEDLIKAGADGLKVGIGPSSVCSTRIISGAGVPQMTAIMDVVSVAKKYNIPVCADGGMKYPGDVAKAIAAGASSIFSGYFFAGTDEAPGMIILKEGRRYKKYIGSASYESNHIRQEIKTGQKVSKRLDVYVEGISNLVDYKGAVSEVIKNIVKGIQSGISYCGGRDIAEMQKNAEFIEITSAGWEESNTRGYKLSE